MPAVRDNEWNMEEDLAILIEGDLENVVVDGITIDGFEEGIIYGDPETQENITFQDLTIVGGLVGIGNTYPEHTDYFVKSLLVKNVKMRAITGIGIHCGDEAHNCAQNVLVQDVEILGSEGNKNDTGYDSLAMVNSDNILVVDSSFSNAPGDGLDFKATRVAVVNSIVENPNRNGIKFWHEGEIINSIVYRTGADAGIVFDSDTEDAKFRIVNSVLAQHLYDLPEEDRYAYAMTIGYDTQVSCNIELINNIFDRFIHEDRFVVLGDQDYTDFHDSNLFADPKFSDPVSGDWKLNVDSPAVNSGERNSKVPDFDIDWGERSTSKAVDIGPYEVQDSPR